MSRPVRPLQYIPPAGASGLVTPGSILTAKGGDGSVAEWADPFQADVINHIGENTVSLYGVVDAHNELVTGLGRTGIANVEPHLWFAGFGRVGIEIEHTDGSTVEKKTYKPYTSSSDTPLIPISQAIHDLNALFTKDKLEWIYQGNMLSLFIKKGSVKFNAPTNSGTSSDQILGILFNGAINKPSISDTGLPLIEHIYTSPKSFTSNPFIGSLDTIYPNPETRFAYSSDILFKRDQDSVAMTFSPSTTNTTEGSIKCVDDGTLKLGMKHNNIETTLSVAASSPHVSIKSKDNTKIGLGDSAIAERASIELDTHNNRVAINGTSGTTLRIGMPIHDGTSVGSVGQVLRSENTGNPKWRYGGASFVETYTVNTTVVLSAASPNGIKDLYDAPAYYVRIFAHGGGGGGAGGSTVSGGGGGGAGNIIDTFLKLPKDTTLDIKIGKGGSGGLSESNSSNNLSTMNGRHGDPTTIEMIDPTTKLPIQSISARGGGGGESGLSFASAIGGSGSVAGKDGSGPLGGKGGGLFGGNGSGITRDAGRNTGDVDSFYSGAGGGGGGNTGEDGGDGASGFVRIEIYME